MDLLDEVPSNRIQPRIILKLGRDGDGAAVHVPPFSCRYEFAICICIRMRREFRANVEWWQACWYPLPIIEFQFRDQNLDGFSMVQAVHTERQPAIELRRLHRFFGETRAVNDVSFEVYPGQVFGFIGPNGAGKTTTMRILSTLELPNYGDAFIDGVSAISDPDLVRGKLGFMPDGITVYKNMNCIEYLDFFARSYGILGADRIEALKTTLAFTGLDKIASKPINGLSKGMRQRLSLGRAMIHKPSVLVLDEPANGLDPRARIELRQMIQELASNGTTVLVSSHILTELAEMCDQVGIIERGKLIAVGDVESIRSEMAGGLKVKIRCLGRHQELMTLLQGGANIQNARLVNDLILCTLEVKKASDAPMLQASLLKGIVQAGFEISEFTVHQESLEDVFMKITTGAVQ